MRSIRKKEEFSVSKYLVSGLLALVASPAFAGGIERNPQSMNILFQEGNYLELGATYGRPRVSGSNDAFAPGGTGNIARSFVNGSLSFKSDINEQLSYAIILDQPFGANTLYPSGNALSEISGKVDNTTLTGILRYKFGNGFSTHAGLRSSWTRGEVNVPEIPPVVPGSYSMSTKTDQAFGYLVGVAYEMPEIAMRVALTYNSKIKHDFDATEVAGGATIDSTFNTNLPQSVNLEFQTGVAEDTLVFGSVRWVNWKDFEISPSLNEGLVSYDKNSTTYTLGVGRRFNENWSGSVSLAHDTGNGSTTGNLGPIGTRNSIGLGVSYTKDAVTISGGVQYSKIGNVDTTLGSEFKNNSAIGAGLRIGYSF